MYLAKLVGIGALVAAFFGCYEASAQQSPDNPFKEVQLGTNAFTVAEPVPSWVDQTPIPDVVKSQPIVVRLIDSQYLVDQTPVIYVRRATLLNDTASLTAAGRLSISFAPEYEHVQLHSIYIYRGPDRLDRTASSNIRFLQREQSLESGVYSGRVTASILVDDLRVGDTLDVSYSIYGQNPVFAGKFIGIAGWDQSYPTLRRRVVLNYPVSRQISWRMVGDRPAAPVVPIDSIRDGMHRLEFNQLSMSETVNDAQVAPDFFGFRFLQFSEFGSWNEVVDWARGLFETRVSLGDELQAVVQRIRALNSDEARLAAALEFAQSQIRYFSVSLGESSHRPASPDVVMRRRYGDCKDKSLLLVTLLHELGIQAKPVLLQIGRRGGLEKALPSPQFFNHAIVLASLGDKTYFLDPTRLGQHGLLARMGQAHEGAQVLVVAAETRELSNVPPGNPDIVRDEIVERATLPKLGEEGKLEIRRTLSGLAAERLRVIFERTSHEQLMRGLGNAMERRYPGARLAGEPAFDDDPVQNVFSFAMTYTVPRLATDKDGNWLVYFKPDNMQDIVITSPSARRTMPLRIPGYPFHGKYSFEITFPEEVSVTSDPQAKTIANKYFSLTASSYFRGNVAKKSIELSTLRYDVDAENYPGYADDLRSANNAIGGVFVINKYAIKSKDAGVMQDFPTRLRGLAEQVIKKTTETIGNSKLAGSDLADAYCMRSEAFSNLERHDEALQDANSAIRLAPNGIGPLSCRAEVYFHTGQFEKSIADYSKAISLGATEAFAFRGRGISRFYAARFDEAAADFTKAGELADKETRVNCDIWLAATDARLGKPVPGDIVKRAAAEARGEWPRAGLAMLTGAMSPDDMLKLLDEKKSDERDMALSEGYFYLGEHYLAAGDRQTAQTYFEKGHELDVIIYTEHIAAGFELQRLKSDGSTSAAAPPETERTVAH